MYIGQVGTQNYYNKVSSVSTRSALVQLAERLQSQQTQNTIQPNVDRVELSMTAQRAAERNQSGLCEHNSGGLRNLFPNGLTYTQMEPDAKLKAEIIPASEKTEYTERDALMDQYMKQFRIEEGKPVKLILADQVSDEELENLRQSLCENGLGEDIDWRGVKDDFWNMGINFQNTERLETKADYLASRYAVLKDRIQTQYIGDEQTAQMQTLDKQYTDAKEEMADAFGKNIGGFYEWMGQTGTAADMKTSILAMVDEKAVAYKEYLAGAGDYTKLSDSQDKWLAQDDAFMAARLRESYAETKTNIQSMSSQGVYSINDLMFAGVYAKSLSSQIQNAGQIWDTSQSDSKLGTFLAKQNKDTGIIIGDADISDNLINLIENTFQPFMDKFMDALDSCIDQNQALVNKNSWMSGLVRTNHIDRNDIYTAFYSATNN